MDSDAVAGIVNATGIPVEFGGGLRTDDDIRLMLDAGVGIVRTMPSPA